MKTAVLFFGLVQRSLRHVVGDIRRHLLEPLSQRGPVEVFFHSWITGSLNNPEWVLMKWLEHRRIPVKMIDFVFQRIRADGKVFGLDRRFSPGGGK